MDQSVGFTKIYHGIFVYWIIYYNEPVKVVSLLSIQLSIFDDSEV